MCAHNIYYTKLYIIYRYWIHIGFDKTCRFPIALQNCNGHYFTVMVLPWLTGFASFTQCQVVHCCGHINSPVWLPGCVVCVTNTTLPTHASSWSPASSYSFTSSPVWFCFLCFCLDWLLILDAGLRMIEFLAFVCLKLYRYVFWFWVSDDFQTFLCMWFWTDIG